MTTSLKSYMPILASTLGATPAALYERQRALVREGLLDSAPGRGPGSGVHATPESVAVLLIGMLASGSLTEAGPLARVIGNARSTDGKCPLTGATRFRDALACILGNGALANRVRDVMVGQTIGQAIIHYDGAPLSVGPERWAADKPKGSIFVGKAAKRGGIRFTTDIPADVIIALAKGMPR